jgi:hypothetical protein
VLRIRSLILLLVVALAAAACGESEVDLVSETQAAAESTVEEGTAGVAFTTEVMGQTASFEGAFDFDERRAQLSADGASFGFPGQLDVVFDYADGAVMYLAVPDDLRSQLGGKSHLSIDMADAMAQAGIDADLGEIIGAQSSDPTSGLTVLRGASEVEELGTEEVRGTETRHLRVTVDLDKMVEESPEAVRDDMQTLRELYTKDSVVVDVWLDDDDRVRRYTQTTDYDDLELPGDASQTMAGQSMTITTEYFDFGREVDISLPDPADTASMADLLQGQGSTAPGN